MTVSEGGPRDSGWARFGVLFEVGNVTRGPAKFQPVLVVRVGEPVFVSGSVPCTGRRARRPGGQALLSQRQEGVFVLTTPTSCTIHITSGNAKVVAFNHEGKHGSKSDF